MSLDVIRKFDPWGDPWCTCPPKYSLNPYTGCPHRCVYCYITSYIPRAFECRPKTDLITRVKRDLDKIDRRSFISLSNSSDPYPPQERKLRLTRQCLEIFRDEGIPFQIVTKSDLVLGDLDILRESRCVVSFTITTLREEVRKKLEPGAPPGSRRLKAIEELTEAGIPTTLRLDPVIPLVNEFEIGEIVEAAVGVGVSHITSSTFKPRPDSWRRFSKEFPRVATQIGEWYFRFGSRHKNAWYLPEEKRMELMKAVGRVCEKISVSFGTCRENLGFAGPSCDGSHLLYRG